LNSVLNIVAFIFISLIPLTIFEYIVSENSETTAYELLKKTEEMGRRNLESAQTISSVAIENAVAQLDEKATQAIEVRTIGLATRVADFLRERDHDALDLALSPPSAELYLHILETNRKDVILGQQQPSGVSTRRPEVLWKNANNQMSWHHIPPSRRILVSKPIYKEITFVDLKGMEKIKVREGKVAKTLKNISIRENTYCKAEDYFEHVKQLKKNELYVSKVVGEYVRGWLYKEDGALKIKSESAYAGKENLTGKKFEGLVRWVTPVYRGGEKIGYLTLALDHTHIMEFSDHVVPIGGGFSAISDAGSGNYAFIWDCDHQSISHPRDFFICGFDPETGEEVPGWVSQKTFNEYKQSGLSLGKFVSRLPSFRNFINTKKGSREQLIAGAVGLDCRILDQAPQCEGWSRGTEDGGAGSFLIFWSGLWKLTTYATIPYYTGQYAESPRGFGYVTIGANIKDFHKAAALTKKHIERSLKRQEQDIAAIQAETKAIISANVANHWNQVRATFILTALAAGFVAIMLGTALAKPLRQMSRSAQAIGDGDYDQSIDVRTHDEIGQLGNSLNKMAQDIATTNTRLTGEINERLRIEEALKISEKRYRDIFESAIEGIFQTTFSGDLISANPRMSTIFGYESAAEMISFISNTEFQLYVDSSRRQAFLSELLHDGACANFEVEMYKKDKEIIWVSMNARIACDSRNDPLYIEGFIIDITEKKAAEKEKENLHERLLRSKKMEALGLLAGGVAHDLNNVLAGIVGYPQLLLTQIPEESPMRSKLLAIQNSGMKAADIVQDLLTLARRGVSITEVININHIIDEELESLKLMVRGHDRFNIDIDVLLDPNLMCIKGSSVHLKKTLMNLFSNALDAVENNGHITISTKNQYVDCPIKGYDEISEGDFVLLSIADNGTGIDDDSLKRIFEPFYTTKRMGRSGTGLGMSVVWGTVQDHGGYINVDSSVGQGTIIQLYFPATRAQCSLAADEVLPIEYTGQGETILVIDDVEEQRDLAESLLSRLNYVVEVVSSGQEAIDYLQTHTVDLLVLDMIMPPGMDGLETYRQIIKLHPGQKAIIASGFSENDRVEATMKLGAGEYVRKPYTLERIGLAVKRELKR